MKQQARRRPERRCSSKKFSSTGIFVPTKCATAAVSYHPAILAGTTTETGMQMTSGGGETEALSEGGALRRNAAGGAWKERGRGRRSAARWRGNATGTVTTAPGALPTTTATGTVAPGGPPMTTRRGIATGTVAPGGLPTTTGGAAAAGRAAAGRSAARAHEAAAAAAARTTAGGIAPAPDANRATAAPAGPSRSICLFPKTAVLAEGTLVLLQAYCTTWQC